MKKFNAKAMQFSSKRCLEASGVLSIPEELIGCHIAKICQGQLEFDNIRWEIMEGKTTISCGLRLNSKNKYESIVRILKKDGWAIDYDD